jgi:hypothetical protein
MQRIHGDFFGTEAGLPTSPESSLKVCKSHLRVSQITRRDGVTAYIYLTDESRKAWSYCHPDESDGTAFLLLYEALIGDPVHEVEAEDRTTCRKLLQKGLLAAFYKCWTGWAWIDAGNIRETLAGVLMPPPSAER